MNKNDNTEIAYKRIAGAILLQAVKDWQLDDYKPEVTAFLSSNLGNVVARLLDIDPESINWKLLSGNFQLMSIRAAYRKKTSQIVD